jgi:Tfp pilus assembly protein PilF
MHDRKQIINLLISIGLLAAVTGCNFHNARTTNARLRFERAKAKTKVCVAEELFQNGEVNKAEWILHESLQVNSETPEGHLLMGKIHYVQSRFDSARESFLAALELNKNLQQARDFLEMIEQMKEQQADSGAVSADTIALKQ